MFYLRDVNTLMLLVLATTGHVVNNDRLNFLKEAEVRLGNMVTSL
jgi:hypothetical protein